MQVMLPGALHVPRGQHNADPEGLKNSVGGRQNLQSEAPLWPLYMFWGQGRQEDWPALGWYDPAGHDKHTLIPVPGANVPLGQGRHAEELVAEDVVL